MQNDVHKLYADIQNVLIEPGNNIADVALWFWTTYLSNSENNFNKEVTTIDKISTEEDEQEQIVEVAAKPAEENRKLKQSQRHLNKPVKRADSTKGIKSKKFDSILQDIQSPEGDDEDDYTSVSEEDATFAAQIFSNNTSSTLNEQELLAMANMIEEIPVVGKLDPAELKRIQKAEQFAMNSKRGWQ